MLKAIGRLAKSVVKAGVPVAGRALEEVIDNAVPGGDIGLDATKVILGSVFGKKPDEAMDELTKRIDKADPAQIKELERKGSACEI